MLFRSMRDYYENAVTGYYNTHPEELVGTGMTLAEAVEKETKRRLDELEVNIYIDDSKLFADTTYTAPVQSGIDHGSYGDGFNYYTVDMRNVDINAIDIRAIPVVIEVEFEDNGKTYTYKEEYNINYHKLSDDNTLAKGDSDFGVLGHEPVNPGETKKDPVTEHDRPYKQYSISFVLDEVEIYAHANHDHEGNTTMIYLDQYVTNQDGSRSTVSVAVGRNGYVSQRVHLNAGLNEFVIRVVSESGVYSEDYYIDIFRTTANLDPEWAKIANENTVKPDPYAAFMPMSGSAVQGSFGSYVMGDVDPALNAKPTLNFLPQDTESVIALVTMYRKDANGLYTESKTTRPTNNQPNTLFDYAAEGWTLDPMPDEDTVVMVSHGILAMQGTFTERAVFNIMPEEGRFPDTGYDRETKADYSYVSSDGSVKTVEVLSTEEHLTITTNGDGATVYTFTEATYETITLWDNETISTRPLTETTRIYTVSSRGYTEEITQVLYKYFEIHLDAVNRDMLNVFVAPDKKLFSEDDPGIKRATWESEEKWATTDDVGAFVVKVPRKTREASIRAHTLVSKAILEELARAQLMQFGTQSPVHAYLEVTGRFDTPEAIVLSTLPLHHNETGDYYELNLRLFYQFTNPSSAPIVVPPPQDFKLHIYLANSEAYLVELDAARTDGTPLTLNPGFDMNRDKGGKDYVINIDDGVSSIDFPAIKAVEGAHVQVQLPGTSSFVGLTDTKLEDVAIKLGQNTMPIRVVSEDESVVTEYTVVINNYVRDRVSRLRDIQLIKNWDKADGGIWCDFAPVFDPELDRKSVV